MKITTLLTGAAVAAALSGAAVLSAAPAQAATPAPATATASAISAVPRAAELPAPSMGGLLVGLGSSATPDVIGNGVEPNATVQVQYAGHTTTVTAGAEGFWSAPLPGGDFVVGGDTVTAVQIVDGQHSAAGSYTIPMEYLPFF